jgi:hypothetical protein
MKWQIMKTSISLKSLMIVATLAVLTGCAASVPMASEDQDADSKTFTLPASDQAGVYIYRLYHPSLSSARVQKKGLYIDGVHIGKTVPGMYFHRTVKPGEHTITTELEIGAKSLKFSAEGGKNYYFQQNVTISLVVGGWGIVAVTEEVGKQNVLQCNEAK